MLILIICHSEGTEESQSAFECGNKMFRFAHDIFGDVPICHSEGTEESQYTIDAYPFIELGANLINSWHIEKYFHII